MLTQRRIWLRTLHGVFGAVAPRFVNILATVSFGTLLTFASHAQGLIVNGGFETPISNNTWGFNPTTWSASQTFGGWTVEFGQVDIVNTPYSGLVPAHQGNQWIDLNGGSRGAIYQNFTVSVDGLYRLQFAMNGNYSAGFHYDRRSVRVEILQGPRVVFQQDYTHFYNGLLASDAQLWITHSDVINLSADTYTLRIESLEFRAALANYGPAVDDIQLDLVPEPASMIALGTGLASLLGFRRRRQA